MKLSYNVTGSERKSLVGAISTALDTPARYLGAPTFAYEIGSYRIDKTGTLSGPDNLDLEDALHQLGFDADGDSRKYDEPDTYESGLGGMGAVDETQDIDQHHPGRYINTDAPITDIMQRQLDEVLTLVIEMPRADFTDTALDNLGRLVRGKASLIKKALGIDSHNIIKGEETISFPWFHGEITPEEVKAYTRFITALCDMAKSQKRVNVTEKQVDNAKYAFRCFLLRLGFIGPEFKGERKVLLSRLEGSSAFKDGRAAPKEGEQ